MPCPPETFQGVNREAFDCLKQRARAQGATVPDGDSGTISGHGVSADFRWDEGSETLTITITRNPAWADCAGVASMLRMAIRACGGRG